MHSGTFTEVDVEGSETLGHVQPHGENSSHQPLIPKVPGEQMHNAVGLAVEFGAGSLVLAKSAYLARVTRFFDVTANGHKLCENALTSSFLMKNEKVEKIKKAENLLVAPLESAPARTTVAADELGADGVGFADGVDRVVENVAEEVEILENFGGLSEEKGEISEKNQDFSEKVLKLENTASLDMHYQNVGEV